MVQDDGIAEFPEAQAQKQAKRQRVKLPDVWAAGLGFRFHAACIVPLSGAKGNLQRSRAASQFAERGIYAASTRPCKYTLKRAEARAPKANQDTTRLRASFEGLIWLDRFKSESGWKFM
jgi:hypothetical protein